jgi:tetrahydromethanopterin S-methyltransferase subunit F
MTTEGEPSAAEADTVSIETETKDLRYERWSHAVHDDYVTVDLFRYVQFINREEEVMSGSESRR